MQEEKYNIAIVIGRFQPFHSSHQDLIDFALSKANKVLLLIGSHQASLNIKNPFTYEERVEMISSCYKDKNIEYLPIRDYFYNEDLWLAEVQQKTSDFIKPNDSVCLVGSYSDASSYYLNLFPQWDFIQTPRIDILHATDIRQKMFNRDQKFMPYNPYHPNNFFDHIENLSFIDDIPKSVYNWMIKNYFSTARYADNVQEFNFVKNYKKQWEAAPFAPIFVTVDNVVVCCGHVLIIERGINPGKGKLALPGGFLKQDETLETAAVRELKEETGIKINKSLLKNLITDNKVFDYPNRSLRGRTITHAFYMKIKGELPEIKGGDDANKAVWMSISDIHQNQSKFHEDHYQILNFFITKN